MIRSQLVVTDSAEVEAAVAAELEVEDDEEATAKFEELVKKEE